MANQSASDDIYCTVNNDETSNHAPVNSLKIESGAGQTVRFTVDESGDVTLTNTLERSGTFTIYDSSSSDGDIVQFASSAGVVVGSVAHYAASTKILFATTEATDTTLALRSGKNIKVQMGFDNDGVGTGGFSVESGGITLLNVTGDGSAATWNLSAGVSAQVSANNSAYTLTSSWGMGSHSTPARGAIRIKRRTGAVGNFPGILKLQDKNGTDYYLWVDTSNRLRISTTDPNANDTAGNPVGNQP